MGDKDGWSEEKTNIWGEKYTQHYDEVGGKAGTSEETSAIFGDNYAQHFDKDGNKAGTSEGRETIFGEKYSQHFEEGGNKAGTSEGRETIFGEKYSQHLDGGGNKTGTSEHRSTIGGDRYKQHYSEDAGAPDIGENGAQRLGGSTGSRSRPKKTRPSSSRTSAGGDSSSDTSGGHGWAILFALGLAAAVLINSEVSDGPSKTTHAPPAPKVIPKPMPAPKRVVPTREIMKLQATWGKTITLTNKGLSGIYGHEEIPFEKIDSITLKDMNGRWSIVIKGPARGPGNYRRDLGCPKGEKACRKFYKALVEARTARLRKG